MEVVAKLAKEMKHQKRIRPFYAPRPHKAALFASAFIFILSAELNSRLAQRSLQQFRPKNNEPNSIIKI